MIQFQQGFSRCFTPEIVPYLSIVFNQTIDMREETRDWKLARIIAVFKEGKKDITENYRLASLASVSSKILKHITFHLILEYYEQYEMLRLQKKNDHVNLSSEISQKFCKRIPL